MYSNDLPRGYSIPGFSWVGRKRVGTRIHRRGGGVGFFISNDVSWSLCDCAHGEESLVLCLEGRRRVMIAGVYLPPDRIDGCKRWVRTLKHLHALRRPTVTFGDWNAHHAAWGSYCCNPAGTLFSDWLAGNGWSVLNDGEQTYSRRAGSVVDLTVTNNVGLVSRFAVDYDFLPADHYGCLVTFGSGPVHFRETPKLVRNFRLANWEDFREYFSCHPWPYGRFVKVKPALNFFFGWLNGALDWAVPVRKVTSRSQPWMSWEIKQVIHQRDKLRKKAQCTGNFWMVQEVFLK